MDSVLGNILGKIGSFTAGIRLRNDDDFIDRLSHRYTTIILLIFTAVVSTKQFVGDPIHCWCPVEYKSAPYYEYINQVCWVSNTYYIPMDSSVPTNPSQRENRELTYYQWVPMILLFMALLFKIPRIIWKVLTSSTSFNLDKFITMVREIQLAPSAERKDKLNDLVNYIHEWRETSKQHHTNRSKGTKRQIVYRNTCLVCGLRYGNYFMVSALLVKVLYVVNASSQFFVLNDFLGTDFGLFGIEVINGLASGNEGGFEPLPRFPFVTLCDFKLRQFENIQNWTIQCVLPINLFNEKIFLFIWFWLVMLCVLTSVSLLTNSYAVMVPTTRLQYIKKFLKVRHVYLSNTEEKLILYKFVHSYLKFDGVYVIRVAGHNGTEILVAQLIEKLYTNYKIGHGITKQSNGELVTVKYEKE